MTTPDFSQYDEKVAQGLRGSASTGGGLAAFLAIEHVAVGPGTLHARLAGARRATHAVPELARRGARGTLRPRARQRPLPRDRRGSVGRDDGVQDQLSGRGHDRRPRRGGDHHLAHQAHRVVRIDVENEGRLVCAAQGTVLVVAPPRIVAARETDGLAPRHSSKSGKATFALLGRAALDHVLVVLRHVGVDAVVVVGHRSGAVDLVRARTHLQCRASSAPWRRPTAGSWVHRSSRLLAVGLLSRHRRRAARGHRAWRRS